MQLSGHIRDYIYRRWHYGRFRWRYLANKDSTLQHYRRPLPVSTALACKALSDLRRDGVTVFHVHDLAGGKELFEEIVKEERLGIEEHVEQITHMRGVLQSGVQESFKDFLVRFTPGVGNLTYHQASTKLALHTELLGIVNAHLGMYSELRNLEFWYTLASPLQTARASQLWHRDFEDIALVKVFLYLSDVDSESGPFSFVRGSHRGRLRWCDPKSIVPSGTIRVDDENMATMVPRDRWSIGIGPAGTVIMAVTKGYHKGGLAIKRDRRLMTMAYMSRSCKENYLPRGISDVPVDAHSAVRFAAQQDIGIRLGTILRATT
jgi:hypothetical protein